MSNYEIQIQGHIRKTDDDITEEVHQGGDGDFRTVVSGASGQSIDACEQALLAVNYPALRDALSGHLSEVSQEAAARDRIGALKKTPRPTRSMVKSGALALRRTVECICMMKSSTTHRESSFHLYKAKGISKVVSGTRNRV